MPMWIRRIANGDGFGILFATGITLLLIPALTLILEDIVLVFKGRKP